MGCSCSCFSSSNSTIMLLLLLLFTLSLSFHPTSSADFIQQTCKTTKYYDLCVSSLKSDSSSTKADAKGLALIMVRVAMANASATNSHLSSQMLTAANDTSIKKAIKECADKYAFANAALNTSLQDLGNDLYDYAYVHVMAAADYPNACRNAFKRSPALLYPPEIALREDALKRICDVALGIIDALAF